MLFFWNNIIILATKDSDFLLHFQWSEEQDILHHIFLTSALTDVFAW